MITLYAMLNALTWASRANTAHSLTQARNWDDVINITAQCFITECLLQQAKNIVRNQYFYY